MVQEKMNPIFQTTADTIAHQNSSYPSERISHREVKLAVALKLGVQ